MSGPGHSISVNVPSGWVAGDLLLGRISGFGTATAAPAPTTPSGWTSLGVANTGGTASSVATGWYYRIAASEPASYTFANAASGDSWIEAEIVAYSGVNTSSPFNLTTLNAAALSGDPTAPNLGSTALDGCWHIIAICGFHVPTVTPSGYTVDVSEDSLASLSMHKLISPAGATGAQSMTTGGGGWTAFAAALQPIGSGQDMPVGDIIGWTQVYTDDFNTNVALGSFPTAVSSKWTAYGPGWSDGNHGIWDAARTISQHDSMMDIWCHTESTIHYVGAAMPQISPSVEMAAGRFVCRLKVDSAAGYYAAFLLWPSSGVWPRDGEIDFPEGDLNSTVSAFMHRQGATLGSDADGYSTSTTFTGWHTYAIEWQPLLSSCKFYIDDVLIGNSTSRVPTGPMHWVIQSMTSYSSTPADVTEGHFLVDWVVAYTPAAGGDTTPPTVPGGVGASAISATRIDVSWTASTDAVGVTGYVVRRGGSIIATLGAVTSYSDTSVLPSTTYSYTIDAFDAAGNHSAQSSSASATTASATTYAGLVSSHNPLSWWRGGEASGPFADQQGRFPATANGSMTRGVAGSIGSDADAAFSLDGSTGYLSTPIYPRPGSIMTYPLASVFNADTSGNKATWATAHGSAVTISAFWDRLQTSQGAALVGAEVTNLNTAISDAKAQNLEVILEIALQYPPTWAKTAIAQFKDQSAVNYSSATAGEDVRDWVWTSNGRSIVSDYVQKVLAAVANLNTNVQRMRIGGGFFGELHYPRNGAGPNYQFWGYGTAPQSGTGLASDQSVCPWPGYVPFYDAGRTDAKDAAWLNWYWQSLGNFALWLIDQHRSGGFTNRLHVLHPGGGVRSNQIRTDANYQQASAAGEHPSFMLDVYKVRNNVWPSCTYLDNADNVTPPVNDSDKAAWRKIRDEAAARGLDTDLWGENVGGNDATAMTYIMGSTGPIQNGYKGITWLSFASLSPSGPLATLTTDLDNLRNAVTAAGSLVVRAKLPNNPVAHGGLMGWRNDTTADFYMLQLLGTNTIECRFRNSAGTAFTTTSSALTPGVWHHLALVYSGSTLTLYSDGVQVAQATGVSGKMANAGQLQIGKIASNFFNGPLDEPAVYDYALSTTQISAQVAAAAAAAATPLAASGWPRLARTSTPFN